jgi:mRNA-degrading endonuclease RelE of RelBE toxin-antitoxin system
MAIARITPEAQKKFQDLPLRIQARVANIFERLNDWPEVSGAKPLRGDLAGHFRVRTGAYRVQFYVDENGDPVVEKIGHRDGFYEE